MNEIPDYFQPLPAWRKFSSTAGDTVLMSVGVGSPWPVADIGPSFCQATPNVMVEYAAHRCPSLECVCGFYAYKTRDDAMQHAQGTILARVEVWGWIVEHTRGYRAERMKILELFVAPHVPSHARTALEARYHVPVTVEEGVNAWTSENPFASSPWSPYPSQSPNQPPSLSYLTFQHQYIPSKQQPLPTRVAQGLLAQQSYQNAYINAYQQMINSAPKMPRLYGEIRIVGPEEEERADYADHQRARRKPLGL